MSEPVLIVMAAGIGSRYGGMKQIEPIGPRGEIILDYSVYDARRSGFGKIVFVINRGMERAFRSRIDQTIGKHCEVEYVYQDLDNLPGGFQVPDGRVKPWGTAHAILSCRAVVDSPFAVINADDFYGRSAYQSLDKFLQGGKSLQGRYNFCMVGYQLKNTLTEHGFVSRGICSVDPQGYLREVRERTHIQKFDDNIKYTEDNLEWIDIPTNSIVSMNIWGFTPELLDELEAIFELFLVENRRTILEAEFFLPEVVNQLLAGGKAVVKVLPTNDRWFGVTYQEDVEVVRKAVNNMIINGDYPEKLWG